MRIWIHSINYAPEVIGVGKYNVEMGQWLANRGHALVRFASTVKEILHAQRKICTCILADVTL